MGRDSYYEQVDIGKNARKKKRVLLENQWHNCFAVGKGGDGVAGVIGECENGTYKIYVYEGGFTQRKVKDLKELFVVADREDDEFEMAVNFRR